MDRAKKEPGHGAGFLKLQETLKVLRAVALARTQAAGLVADGAAVGPGDVGRTHGNVRLVVPSEGSWPIWMPMAAWTCSSRSLRQVSLKRSCQRQQGFSKQASIRLWRRRRRCCIAIWMAIGTKN